MTQIKSDKHRENTVCSLINFSIFEFNRKFIIKKFFLYEKKTLLSLSATTTIITEKFVAGKYRLLAGAGKMKITQN